MVEVIRFLALARGQWLWMLSGVILGITVLIANSLLMAISGWFIASMAVAAVTGIPFNYILPAAAIRAFALLRTTGRYGERLVTHEAGLRALEQLRLWFFLRLEPLAPAGLERYTAGDLSGRLRSDVDLLESLYLRVALPLITGFAAIPLAGLFVSLWNISAATALLICLLLAGIPLPLLSRYLARGPGRKSVELAGEMRRVVTEGLQGGEELLLLGAVEMQSAKVEKLSSLLIAEQMSLFRINSLSMAGTVICAALGLTGILATVGPEVECGSLSGPVLVMLLLFAAASFEGVAGMSMALQLLPVCREAIRRIRELADAPPPLPEPKSAARVPSEFAIALKAVTFSYVPDRSVLKEFSLSIEEGERVALLGPSGCGKSSIAEILLRFRPYQGSITIGGQEICDLNGDDLRRLISGLRQSPHLFNTTIRENILLARPQATEEELQQVLFDAALDEWVATLPDGIETQVGEGGGAISGGEGRRIALARALLKDAPILILDEPTEGLDLATEIKVVRRLSTRLSGKTVLIVTHRPACLDLVNRTVVIPSHTTNIKI